VNRTLAFVSRYYDGVIPKINSTTNGTNGTNKEFWKIVRKFESDITEKFDRADERDAFRAIFELCSFANKAFQDGEPWRKRKGTDEEQAEAAALIGNLTRVVRDLAILIQPYMPEAAEKIASFFGHTFGPDLVYKVPEKPQTEYPRVLSWDCLGKSECGLERVFKSEVLFSKLEDDRINELRDRYSGTQAERNSSTNHANLTNEEKKEGMKDSASTKQSDPTPSVPPCPRVRSFKDTLDLRVAHIVKAEKHPQADKLFVINLNVGTKEDGTPDERVICSGLVGLYTAEELTGKDIIVAYNLKPRKMRGIESHGMLLAAQDMLGPADAEGKPTERVEVLDASGCAPGTRVILEGEEAGNPPETIDIDTFFSIPIEAVNNAVVHGGKALTVGGRPVKTALVVSGEVH
jgi:methionyl-tRNA synthetase